MHLHRLHRPESGPEGMIMPVNTIYYPVPATLFPCPSRSCDVGTMSIPFLLRWCCVNAVLTTFSLGPYHVLSRLPSYYVNSNMFKSDPWRPNTPVTLYHSLPTLSIKGKNVVGYNRPRTESPRHNRPNKVSGLCIMDFSCVWLQKPLIGE